MAENAKQNTYPACPHCGENRLKSHDPRRLICRGCGKTISRKVLALSGWSPEHDMTRTVPDGFTVKGTSTLYRDDGSIAVQWVKTQQEHDALKRLLEAAFEGMADTLPRVKPTAPPAYTDDKLANLYVITDYHLGMLAWGEETGSDWDVRIAENLLVNWFKAAIAAAPAAELGIFCNLGDFLHWDGLEAVTPTNKHVLDADTRFQKLVRVAIRVKRRIVDMLLTKHNRVLVIEAEGNHDPAASIWMREWFTAIYENEPRVIIDRNPDPYYCVEHGATSLFFHHGHKRKMEQVDDVLVAKFRDVFGRTKHSYAHTGHLHHDKKLETSLMTVEQHRTLSAPDAFASRGGWMSGRDAKVITYHKDFGEVARITISPDMVRAAA